jgi:hypothetical protein
MRVDTSNLPVPRWVVEAADGVTPRQLDHWGRSFLGLSSGSGRKRQWQVEDILTCVILAGILGAAGGGNQDGHQRRIARMVADGVAAAGRRPKILVVTPQARRWWLVDDAAQVAELTQRYPTMTTHAVRIFG